MQKTHKKLYFEDKFNQNSVQVGFFFNKNTSIFHKFEKNRKTDKQTDIATILWIKSTREVAFSLGSKGQSLKVSNIWALPLMALPCNGYKLNLLTSASMCHMALCSLCWKLHSSFSFYWKNELKQASSTWCFLCYYYLEFLKYAFLFIYLFNIWTLHI